MIGFIGLLIHRYKLFKLLVCYSITAIGLNLFWILAGNINFDIHFIGVVVLVWAIEAAEAAMVLYILLVLSLIGVNNIRAAEAALTLLAWLQPH